jgi:DMSO/TMAO reductase YedYZ molybdopterin-dependent catalytic subunit
VSRTEEPAAPAATSNGPADELSTWGRIGLGSVLGLITGGMAIAVAELVAGVVNPASLPVVTVGQAAIDASPEWLKSWAIRTFGSNDKRVLLLGIAAVLLVLAVVLGTAAIRSARPALIGLGVLGALGAAAALTRPGARPVDLLPLLAGALAGVATLLWLRRALLSAEPPPARAGRSHPSPGGIDRRRFLLSAAAGAGVALVAGVGGHVLGRRFLADDSRAAVRIPTPASPATGSTSAFHPPVPGLEPFFTPNDAFYRVDTALLVPSVSAQDWSLLIHGMVDRELVLDYEQLLARPLIERDITLNCVSNRVGGPYIGNARWIGVPLRDLLREVGVHPAANQIVTRSVDGFTVGTPTAVVTDGRDAMLAVAMNGEPLPLAHGFPVRMLVPGLYGYVSATKWIADMELATFDAFDAYWVQRGWAQQAPVKISSRIDTPRAGARLAAGTTPVAGIAWAQHVGIQRVEVQLDGGSWAEADLAPVDTVDTWRQWVYRWPASPGDHLLRVRATDDAGQVQTAAVAEPFPDGSTGLHTIEVHVSG